MWKSPSPTISRMWRPVRSIPPGPKRRSGPISMPRSPSLSTASIPNGTAAGAMISTSLPLPSSTRPLSRTGMCSRMSATSWMRFSTTTSAALTRPIRSLPSSAAAPQSPVTDCPSGAAWTSPTRVWTRWRSCVPITATIWNWWRTPPSKTSPNPIPECRWNWGTATTMCMSSSSH